MKTKIPKIGEFHLEENAIGNDLSGETKKNLSKVRGSANKLIIYIYSVEFMNGLSEIKKVKNRFEKFEKKLKSLKKAGVLMKEILAFIVTNYLDKIEKMKQFLSDLAKLKECLLPKRFVSEHLLTKELSNLKIDEQKIKSIFVHDFLDVYYKKKIVKLNYFKLQRKSSLFFNSNTTGLLYYSIHLPFQFNANITKQCTPLVQLPLFYHREKGET